MTLTLSQSTVVPTSDLFFNVKDWLCDWVCKGHMNVRKDFFKGFVFISFSFGNVILYGQGV